MDLRAIDNSIIADERHRKSLNPCAKTDDFAGLFLLRTTQLLAGAFSLKVLKTRRFLHSLAVRDEFFLPEITNIRFLFFEKLIRV